MECTEEFRVLEKSTLEQDLIADHEENVLLHHEEAVWKQGPSAPTRQDEDEVREEVGLQAETVPTELLQTGVGADVLEEIQDVLQSTAPIGAAHGVDPDFQEQTAPHQGLHHCFVI